MGPQSTGAVSSVVPVLSAGLALMTSGGERPLGRTMWSRQHQAEDSGRGRGGMPGEVRLFQASGRPGSEGAGAAADAGYNAASLGSP